MLRVCKELREVDVKSKRLGLVRTETDYLRALQDAMANMDRCVEVEVLKTLGDVNLEKGRLDKNPEKFDSAMVLYRTALIRCEDLDLGESLGYRYHYAEKLRLGKRSTASSSYEPLSNEKKMYSLAKLSEKFLQLDRRLKGRGNRGSVLLEYTKIVIEGIVNCDTMLETEAIKSLGDVYLKRGTETNKDSKNLTKATALYNTALSRCEGFQGKEALIHRLKYTARIRQESTRIQKNQKHRAQQRGHVQREFPMTSPNTGGIDDAKSHQSSSRSYDEYLTTGNHALADGKLDVAEQDFASALRLIHDPNQPNRCKEADCLCRLGEVYVQRGKKTKEGRTFTQAAALYNAAMARSGENNQDMMKRLQDTEHWFLQYTANVDTNMGLFDSFKHHQKRLEEMRTRAKSQLDAIDQQHNPYLYDEDDPAMITVEAERAEAIKALSKNIAQDRKRFIQDLVDECIAILGPPPCKYAFIGLGSQATELVTPYSDLEFAILIEEGNDSDDTKRYFVNLTHYLHLKVINLGETILPAMAIPSLNNFQSKDPEKDWFFDSVTTRGFAFDGFMPWASKTPFGRDQTENKPPVSLIQTPAEMAKFQQIEVSLAEGYHLSDILRRVAFLTGEERLVDDYMRKVNEIMTDDLLSPSQSRLSAVLILDNREQFSPREPTGQLLNVKKDIYRFPGIAIEVLALCCQITLPSAWDVIEELKETEQIQEENATHLMILTSISAELRLRTYLANGGQKDSMSPLVQMKYPQTQEVSDNTLTSIFHIPDTEVLFRYHCRAIPLKKHILDMVENSLEVQPKGEIKTTIFDTSNKCRGQIARNMYLSDRAKDYFEAALNDAGGDLIERSEILDELGNLLFFDGNVAKALRLFEEVLTIHKQFYGDDIAHLGIVGILGNLGLCYSQLGNQKKAISFCEQSLTMQKKIYGYKKAHPYIASSLQNLGSAWIELGDGNKAISYCEQALTMRKAILGDNTAHPYIARILHNLGVCVSWHGLGFQEKAIRYYEQALSMMKTVCGNNTAHPDIANLLFSIGSSWCKLGDIEKAIRYYEQSLTINETIYGGNMAHPHIALSLQNLGSAWSKLGDDKKAIRFYEQAMKMMETIYADNTAHPHIAALLNNIGSSWSKLGDDKKAITFYEKSLTIKKTILGDNTAHSEIAVSLYNMGLAWSKIGDHKKAIRYHDQALTMRKTIYGDNTVHTDIAASLYNLGLSWSECDDHEKAVRYHDQTLTMRKTIYGDKTVHPEIAASLYSLGLSWSKRNDHKKAIKYYEESLTMTKTFYNTAHTDIARALSSLGSSWSKLGDHKKAVSYHEQSLTMKNTIYGESQAHTDIAWSLNKLALEWRQLGDKKKAVDYFEKLLSMLKTIYGDNTARPEIAGSLNNLGLSLSELGDHKKAISYYEQSLTMRKIIYGDKTAHPDIAASLHDLGLCWNQLGDQKKAISYFKQALIMWKTIYGDNTAHPDIALTLSNLGLSWFILGNFRKARNYFEQSLTLERTIYGETHWRFVGTQTFLQFVISLDKS
ncbi:uncharacterized protein LOC144875119 [Branchiostoma floridae x Branchiostoma japonicum]